MTAPLGVSMGIGMGTGVNLAALNGPVQISASITEKDVLLFLHFRKIINLHSGGADSDGGCMSTHLFVVTRC